METPSSKYLNDAPISKPEDDRFGIDPFARSIAQSISKMKTPIGVTIALNGPWGSGKSSAINLILHHLKQISNDAELTIIDFKCWWHKGDEALTLAFLQELNSALTSSLGDKAKLLIPKIGKRLLQTGPVLGPLMNLATGGLWGPILSGSMKFTEQFFSNKDSMEKLFTQLSEALQTQDKRFLILIDDIDRLLPEDALAIFRLIKSIGRLPNVLYLLAFDRALAENAVQEKYPSEGPHFLEKIIQANFDLPTPSSDDLNSAALQEIEGLCAPNLEQDQLRRFMNIFYDAVSPYLRSPRDITRLSNAISVSWPPIANEVNIADFLAIEAIRVFEPNVYQSVRTNKRKLCGARKNYGPDEDPKKEIETYTKLVKEERQDQIKLALMRLFPRLEESHYSSDFIEVWERHRQICTETHFDSYFRMAIGEETLSTNEINTFIENCNDKTAVKNLILEASDTIRKNGKSKVPLLFDEIKIHSEKIPKQNFKPLISALFEVADDIDRVGDHEQGGFAIGDNYLRIHWLIRKLTFKRCDLAERTEIYEEACKSAQIGWLVDFTSSAIHDHFPSRSGEQPEPSEKCLVNIEYVDALRSHTIKKIEDASRSEAFLRHPRLASILFRWKDFIDDKDLAVTQWTNEKLQSDIGVACLAIAFTSESWSQSLGFAGLGDRVSIRRTTAGIQGLDSILDVNLFRERLEEIENSQTLTSPYNGYVKTFLDAWRARDKSSDD